MEAAARPGQAVAMSLLTRADHDHFRALLDELRRVRDRDLPALLRDARGFVASDAEEEIAQIHDDHVFVTARIAQLEALLRDARVVADAEAPGVAFPGRFVEVEYTRSGKRATYRITAAGGAGEAGTVSTGSPVGQALIGRTPGELASVTLPDGRVEEIRIVGVRQAREAAAA